MRKNIVSVLMVLSLFLTLSIISFAQENDSQSEEKIKQEKQELENFLSEFVKSYEQHKDLSKIPTDFFAPNFKDIFAKNDEWIKTFANEAVYKQLNENECYQDNIEIANFLYLMVRILINKGANFDETYSGLGDDKFSRKYLSPQIIRLFKQSKWLRMFVDQKRKIVEPETLTELQSLISDLNKIVENFRKELNSRSEKEIQIYQQNYAKWFTESFYIYGRECEGKDCFGLSEGTYVHSVIDFPIILKIAKIDGHFKILNIDPFDDD